MIFYSILLFSLAAALGLFLIVLGVRYHRNSLKVGLIHASTGLLAMGLLITHVMSDTSNKFYNVAILLMVLAIIGGGMLFALREDKRPPPMMMVAIHAGMAVAALIVLVLGF